MLAVRKRLWYDLHGCSSATTSWRQEVGKAEGVE